MEQNYIKMDFSLESSQERTEHVKKIIANTPPERLNSTYLEKLADYIILAANKEDRKQSIIACIVIIVGVILGLVIWLAYIM